METEIVETSSSCAGVSRWRPAAMGRQLSLDEYLNSAPDLLELEKLLATDGPGMRARCADLMGDRKRSSANATAAARLELRRPLASNLPGIVPAEDPLRSVIHSDWPLQHNALVLVHLGSVFELRNCVARTQGSNVSSRRESSSAGPTCRPAQPLPLPFPFRTPTMRSSVLSRIKMARTVESAV
jgi:hypothetical protein